jgi:hypothetical protein
VTVADARPTRERQQERDADNALLSRLPACVSRLSIVSGQLLGPVLGTHERPLDLSAMTDVQPMTCGATNRHGEPCALPAGWGGAAASGGAGFTAAQVRTAACMPLAKEALSEVSALQH